MYRLGNLLNYRIISEGPGRLALAARKGVISKTSGKITVQAYHLVISWKIYSGEKIPATISVISMDKTTSNR